MAAEHVGGRRAVLARGSAGRSGVPDSARRSRGSRRAPAHPAKRSAAFWPMVRRAAGFIVRNGPVTQQDRWEEDAGYSPFTIAVEVAALLVAADLADRFAEPRVASYLRETADCWNDAIDRSIYVTDTDLARQVGVEGALRAHHAAPDRRCRLAARDGFVPIKNRPSEQSNVRASEIVSPDALAPGSFRPAGPGRSEDGQHRSRDRCAAESGPAGRARVAPVQRRRVRRARGRRGHSTASASGVRGRC